MSSFSFKSLLPARMRGEGPVVPVVRLSGAIGVTSPFRPGLTLASVAGPLEKAFAMKKAPAVAIVVNSPGGSPVQSRQIFERIRQLAAEKEKTVLVYVEDVAASGGYMIACAGDEIIADPSSIVGSIGVVSAGFGFEKAIEKLGVERRVYTAGTRKATLDPFQPENPEDVEHLKALQREVHQVFIDLVRERRGAALSTSEDLFSGLFWSGLTGRALGLVDAVGDMRSDLRRRFGPKTTTKVISAERGFLRRQFSGFGPVQPPRGVISAEELVEVMERRALWSRYGL